MKKRLICALLCGVLCLSPVFAAGATYMDQFEFQEWYAENYAQEHPEEYAAFDAAAFYSNSLYRVGFLPKETWMANRGLDEAGFMAAMWVLHLSTEADAAYGAYLTEAAFPAVKEYPGFADVVAGSWYESAVQTCYEVGLMNGTNRGFEPGKVFTVGECAAVAARIRETLTGEAIPAPTPGTPWYFPYAEYMRQAEPTLTPMLAHADDECNRYMFLRLLSAAVSGQAGLLEPINEISVLPDCEDEMVLEFYRAGILTGKDKYGTFDAYGSLSRAECAAMVARLVRSGLRLSFTPESYAPFAAAYLTPSTVMFENGIKADEFLKWVNNRIYQAEEGALRSGHAFNWHYEEANGQTTLEWVKAQVLTDLGVTEGQGTAAYKEFDYQVYYARYISITGETLEPDYAVGVGA